MINPHAANSPLSLSLRRRRTYKDVEISDISMEDYIALHVSALGCWLPTQIFLNA